MSETNGDIRAKALGGASELAYEEVGAWGGIVRVCEMSAERRDLWENACVEGSPDGRTIDKRNFRARLAVYTVCNAEGQPIFTPDDVVPLGRGPAGPLIEIATIAMRLNHLTDDAVDELKKT